MKTSVIYSRISTGSQDTSSQTEVLKKYSDDHNYTLLESFTETISGTTDSEERKELTRLMKYVEYAKVDLLLTFETSRLGRKTEDVLRTIRYFTERGVNVFMMKENLFTLNEDGTKNSNTELVLTIMASISTVERETTLARSRRGLRRNSTELGHWTGGVLLPYGYKKEGKVLVIDEEESLIVKDIFNLYLNGNGTTLIADELNRRGIKTRYNKVYKDKEEIKTKTFHRLPSDFKWVDGTIYTILKNPLYKGERRYIDEKSAQKKEKLKHTKSVNKVEFKPTFDIIKSPTLQIIDEDTFNKVQERLTGNFNKIGNNTKHFYLLGDILIKCGVCGMSYFAHKRTDGKDNRYICLSERRKPKCDNNGIGIDKLADGVWYMVRRGQDLIRHIQSSIEKSDINTDIDIKGRTLKELETQFKNVDKNENFLVDRVMSGLMSQDIYDRRIVGVIAERKIITEKISKIKSEIKELITYREIQSDLNSQIRTIKGDRNLMKKYLEDIISKITLYPIKNSFTIGKIKDDKNMVVKLNLKSTPSPLYFIITQRSKAILSIKESDYDFTNYSIIGEGMELKRNMKELKHFTEN